MALPMPLCPLFLDRLYYIHCGKNTSLHVQLLRFTTKQAPPSNRAVSSRDRVHGLLGGFDIDKVIFITLSALKHAHPSTQPVVSCLVKKALHKFVERP